MILVTGASGLLGSSVVLRCLENDQDVIALCNHHWFCPSGASAQRLDLTDVGAVRNKLLALRPAAIVHCAAAANVDWCEDHAEDAHRINVSASALLAELAAEMEASFVYISTDSVFDGERGNYSETDTPAPVNVYARTKLLGETEVLRTNPRALVLRVNFYGWNVQPKQNLAEWVLDELGRDRPVPGFTDVFFSPLLADDLAAIILNMLDHNLSGTYHIAGSERTSKYEFARRLAITFGFNPDKVRPSQVAKAKLRARRPRDTSLSTEKISQALQRSMPDIDSGLRKFHACRERRRAQQLQVAD